MKRTLSIVGLVVMVAGLQVALGQAETGKLVRVNVPFAFQVGKDSLPPGQYLIQIDRAAPGTSLGSRLILRSRDGKTARVLTAVPRPSARLQRAGLSFRKYNQTYFLGKVDTSYTECEVMQSRAEKEVSARMGATREHVVAHAE